MAIITFWTELNKEVGQTTSAIAMATQMSIEHNKKVLLLTTYNDDEILSAFFPHSVERKKLLSALTGSVKKVSIDSGITGIAKAITSNRLLPEQITNYTKIVFKGRLEILPGLNGAQEDYKEIKKLYPEIIRKASQYYDIVIVDLIKGINEFSTEIIEMSNIIIYAINQKTTSIELYLQSKTDGFLADRKNVIPFIGRYDQFSKYSTKNLTRTIREKKKLNAIQYNTLLSESMDESMVADYFLKIATIKDQEDRNVKFLKDVRSLTDSTIYRLQELQMRI